MPSGYMNEKPYIHKDTVQHYAWDSDCLVQDLSGFSVGSCINGEGYLPMPTLQLNTPVVIRMKVKKCKWALHVSGGQRSHQMTPSEDCFNHFRGLEVPG